MPDEFDRAVAEARYWRDEIIRLGQSAPKDKPPVRTDALTNASRKFYGALSRCFRVDRDDLNGEPMRPLPSDLAGNLSKLFDYLACGSIPDAVLWVADKRPKDGPTKRRDIQVAVAYLDAAKQKKIHDRTPVLTVQKVYGVKNRSTVQYWMKKYPIPSSGDIYGDEPDRLYELLHNAGKRFKLNRSVKR
ncbi:MAG: hypothetical protein IT539_13840 [Bradyrhizobiaceae bacterium]|nr:hypothetical protein [Bradyrhizobiaceae bacterium]